MEQYTYPSITRRYLSSLIDGLFIASMLIVVAYLFQNDNELATNAKIALVLLLVFVYEPLCTSKLCTIGQRTMGIRVRDFKNHTRIPLHKAYLRIITKIVLGFISLISILFSDDRRAIHDFLAGSIVLEKEA